MGGDALALGVPRAGEPARGLLRRTAASKQPPQRSHGLMVQVLSVMPYQLMMYHQMVTVAVMSRYDHFVRLSDGGGKSYCRSQERRNPYFFH
jgi:hypothetical protein